MRPALQYRIQLWKDPPSVKMNHRHATPTNTPLPKFLTKTNPYKRDPNVM